MRQFKKKRIDMSKFSFRNFNSDILWCLTIPFTITQGSAYEACDRTRTPPHTPKVSKACDKPHTIIGKKGNEACGISHASK